MYYRIASRLFSWGEIFPDFPNWLTTWENLFWTADCFRRLDCGIEILCTQQLQTDREYCLTLVHKQAPRLLPASRCMNGRFYTDSTHPVLTCTKASHVRFSVIILSWISKSGKFLLKLKFTIQENLHLGKISSYTYYYYYVLCVFLIQCIGSVFYV